MMAGERTLGSFSEGEGSGMKAVFGGEGRTPIPPPGAGLGSLRGKQDCCMRALWGRGARRSPR